MTGLIMAKVLHLFLLLAFLYQPALAEQDPSTASPKASTTEDAGVTKTLLWPDGTRYVGGVEEGKRAGKGTIFWQDGTRFVGTFVNDKRNGPGTMILPDGTVYNGYFENDTLVERSDGESIAGSEPTAPIAEISADNIPDALASSPTAKPQMEIAAAITTEISTPDIAAVTTLSEDTREDVQATIDLWAAAWSEQNIDQYLTAYSSEFDVPGRQSRRQWEGMRRSRLSRPSRIEIRVVYDSFEMIAADTVQVDFNQIYDSNLFSDKTDKRLLLKKEDVIWRIVSEESL